MDASSIIQAITGLKHGQQALEELLYVALGGEWKRDSETGAWEEVGEVLLDDVATWIGEA